MTTIEYPVQDRAEWIARLLYAPDEYDRNNTPLFGRTRLMKATFLLERKLDEKLGMETGFEFHPDKFGPLDPGVYDAVTYGENQGWFRVQQPEEHPDKYDLVKYELADGDGYQKGKELFIGLPEEQQELVRWVKNKHAMKKLGRLLTYVYNEYPKMTENSQLV